MMKWNAFVLVNLVCALLCPKPNYSQEKISGGTISSRISNPDTSRSLVKYLNESSWNHLFPHRYGYDMNDSSHNHPDFYSFKSFVSAAGVFHGFLSEGTEEMQKRELAAFLATIAYETGGGWDSASGGYFSWGLYYAEEKDTKGERFNYADTSKKNYLPFPGASYFGRGPIQLSWNYNYGQFSEAWYRNKDSLLENPGRLTADPVLSFASAIWFWMTAQYPKPSCHDIMVGNWTPTLKDSAAGRLPGFGSVVNVINGGVVCGESSDQVKTAYRYKYYQFFCDYFQVSPGENIECRTSIPFGR